MRYTILALALLLTACGGGANEADYPHIAPAEESPLGPIGYNGTNCVRPDWVNVPDCVPAIPLPQPK